MFILETSKTKLRSWNLPAKHSFPFIFSLRSKSKTNQTIKDFKSASIYIHRVALERLRMKVYNETASLKNYLNFSSWKTKFSFFPSSPLQFPGAPIFLFLKKKKNEPTILPHTAILLVYLWPVCLHFYNKKEESQIKMVDVYIVYSILSLICVEIN